MRRLLLACLLAISTLSCSAAPSSTSETAYFAMGCFWCAQADFDKVRGVTSTTVGYQGGTTPNPNYQLVSSGRTNYVEAIKVVFNPEVISYPQLLVYFWHNVDPLRDDGQFCDRGKQYAPHIFYTSPQQQSAAEKSKTAIALQLKLPIKVAISKATTFYPAESYHQSYYKKNPLRYKFYRYRCKRDERLSQLWGPKK